MWKQKAPPTPTPAVRPWWYLTSRLCLESPLTLYPPFPTLPLVSPGSEFLKEGGEASAEPRDEAAGPAGGDGGSAPWRAPRAARRDLGLKMPVISLPHPRLLVAALLLCPLSDLHPGMCVCVCVCDTHKAWFSVSQEVNQNICLIHSTSICPASCPCQTAS